MSVITPEAIEKALINNDLSKLTLDERLSYYKSVCESIGLNPLTQPFDFIVLNGKLRLYAKKDATEQLRKVYGVAVKNLEHNHIKDLDLYIVTASGVNREGREDVSTGAVTVKGLAGESLANAIMKAETKAKRRLTLSICGLGILDETEIESDPKQMMYIQDGKILNPGALAEQTQPTIEPAADTKKKPGRPKKTDVQIPNKPTNFEFGANSADTGGAPKTDGAPAETAPAPSEVSNLISANQQTEADKPVASTNIHGLEITDTDLPSNLQPERMPTEAESKKFYDRCIAMKKSGLPGDKIRAYILNLTEAKTTQGITFQQWETVMGAFDEAENAGKLKELIGA